MKSILFITVLLILILISIFSCKKDDSEPNTVTDIEGNIYTTAVIGNKTWMTENLKVTKLRDGTDLKYIPAKSTGNILLQPGYGTFKGEFFYNTAAVNSINGLAPKGWHIPKNSEFDQLATEFAKSITVWNVIGYKELGTYYLTTDEYGLTGGLTFYSSENCGPLKNFSYSLWRPASPSLWQQGTCFDNTRVYLNIRCVKD